jgi:hypothetical protein
MATGTAGAAIDPIGALCAVVAVGAADARARVEERRRFDALDRDALITSAATCLQL